MASLESEGEDMKPLYGNAVVGQSGGPTAAINATLSGVIAGVGANRSIIPELYGMRNGIEGFLSGDLVALSPLFDDENSRKLLEQTPAAALGSCRKKLPDPEKDPAFFDDLIARFREKNVRYFFYIGGNDSMDTAAKLSAYLRTCEYEMRVIGIPKTIDNDLQSTDHTPGFGSAAKYVAVTLSEIIRDCAVYRIPAVTVVEIMGRDSGWLTSSASIPGAVTGEGVDLIYLPERPFTFEKFEGDVREALKRHPNVVVAISEGIRFPDGGYVGAGAQSGAADAFGHRYLAGAGKVLEAFVKEKIGCKVRSIELSLPQRCGAHIASENDLREAFSIGSFAVESALMGESGRMIATERLSDDPYQVKIVSRDVAEIANKIRTVPDEYVNEDSNGITDAGVRYLLPLIQGERPVVYRNGLPIHYKI